jgi:hypothetical protein
MIALEIKLEKLKEEYSDFYDFFKQSLEISNSRFKDHKEEKYKCFYYVGFYMKPSEKTDEYYQELYKKHYDDRLEEELTKARVTITIVAGKFAISDQVVEVSDTVKPIIGEIVKRKMIMEQTVGGDPDDDVLHSIPGYDDLVEKMQDEQEMQKDFLESMGLDDLLGIKREKELTPDQTLKRLIDEERYEEAEDLLEDHPELRKKGDEEEEGKNNV